MNQFVGCESIVSRMNRDECDSQGRIVEVIIMCLFLSLVSLENIVVDISELEKGMEMTRKEYETWKGHDSSTILKEFHNRAEDILKKLKADGKTAQVRC